MIEPSFPALFSLPSWNALSNLRPFVGSVNGNKLSQTQVFLWTPNLLWLSIYYDLLLLNFLIFGKAHFKI
jgi:hypothetical protein